jgi:hypothetical protein
MWHGMSSGQQGDVVDEEGWYKDPFGRHEARWISVGTPTALVRDGSVESQDPPPSTVIAGEFERVPETAQSSGEDLKRADDAERGTVDLDALIDAGEIAIDSATGL